MKAIPCKLLTLAPLFSFAFSLHRFSGKVGPIAEEVVFRGCTVAVLLGAGVSRTKMIWLSPLLFGFGELVVWVAGDRLGLLLLCLF